VDYGGEYELTRQPDPIFPPFTAKFQYSSSALVLGVELTTRQAVRTYLLDLVVLAYNRSATVIVPGDESFTSEQLFALPSCASGEVRIPDIRNTTVDINRYPFCFAGYFLNAAVNAEHWCQLSSDGQLEYAARFEANSIPFGRWGSPPIPYFLGDPPPLFPYRIYFGTQLFQPVSSLVSIPVATLPYLSQPASNDEAFLTEFDITRVRYVYSDSVVDLPFT
jgi:hypothetical protein